MNQQYSTAYIGIGSNLNHPRRQVCLAIERINAHEAIECFGVSAFYSSKAVASGDVNQEQADQQPTYVNAAMKVKTFLSARLLLNALLLMESEQGRLRLMKGASRTLDLDLLVYESEQIAEPGLLVPHPRIYERAFVLAPLQDISPELFIPGMGSLASLIMNCDMASVKQIKHHCPSAVVNIDL